MPTREEWAKLDRAAKRQRRKTLRETTDRLTALLLDVDFTARLDTIGDEAWTEASQQDAEGSTDAA